MIISIIYIQAIIFIFWCLPYENYEKLEYTSGLLAIVIMILLGFIDDVVDLRWKYKLILPLLAAIPMLLTYDGNTYVIVPKMFRFIFGRIYDLGIMYYIYKSMLSIFCTNAINIYAGINGIEVGQCIVIAASILLHNVVEIFNHESTKIYNQHLFSITIIMPFLFVAMALYKNN